MSNDFARFAVFVGFAGFGGGCGVCGAKKKRRLKKVSTRDKSAPYIPKDMEIYFYAGPNKKEDKDHTNKNLPPLPPVSRTLPNAKEETVKEIQPKAPTFGEAGTYFGESSLSTKTKSR